MHSSEWRRTPRSHHLQSPSNRSRDHDVWTQSSKRWHSTLIWRSSQPPWVSNSRSTSVTSTHIYTRNKCLFERQRSSLPRLDVLRVHRLEGRVGTSSSGSVHPGLVRPGGCPEGYRPVFVVHTPRPLSTPGYPLVVNGSPYGSVPRPFRGDGVQETYRSSHVGFGIRSFHPRGLRISM